MAEINFNDKELDDLTDEIQVELFGFCGCGQPEENIIFIMGGLDLISRHHKTGKPYDKGHYDLWNKESLEYFKTYQIQSFFHYWADSMDLTEHGGGIGGSWLTDKGEDVLERLRFWKVKHDEVYHD
jgi:hypothetical protein